MNQIIEVDNFINENQVKYIDDIILGDNFPWYYASSSTSKTFPFFFHNLICRYDSKTEKPQINSDYFAFFNEIFNKFTDDNSLKVNNILRAAINLTTHYSLEFGDPHVDHSCENGYIIMYLNDDYDGGETIIFNEQYGAPFFDEVNPVADLDRFSIQKEIKPSKGKVIYFNGKYFHTCRWCKEGQRRIICIFTFN